MRRLIDEGREEQENRLRQARAAFSRVGLSLLALTVVARGLQVGLQLLATRVSPLMLEQEAFYWFLTVVPMYLIGMPLCARMLRSLPDAPEPEPADLNFGQMAALTAMTLALSILGGYAVTLLAALVQYLTGRAVPDASASLDGRGLIPTFLVVCIAGPFMEEWLFRGVLVRKLRAYGEGLCVFASGFTFMLLHGNLYQTVNIFLVGMLFAYVAVRTGTIWYSVILHMALNLTSVLISRAAQENRLELLAGLGALLLVALPAGLILLWLLLRSKRHRPDGMSVAMAGLFLGSPGQLLFCLVSLASIAFTAFAGG